MVGHLAQPPQRISFLGIATSARRNNVFLCVWPSARQRNHMVHSELPGRAAVVTLPAMAEQYSKPIYPTNRRAHFPGSSHVISQRLRRPSPLGLQVPTLPSPPGRTDTSPPAGGLSLVAAPVSSLGLPPIVARHVSLPSGPELVTSPVFVLSRPASIAMIVGILFLRSVRHRHTALVTPSRIRQSWDSAGATSPDQPP